MSEISKAARDVLAEREAQVTREGWTPEHDDHHADGSLALAAALYATPRPLYDVTVSDVSGGGKAMRATDPWPWKRMVCYHRYGDDFDRPYPVNDGDKRDKHPRRKQLVVAAALILAEIERLDRAAIAALVQTQTQGGEQ